MSRILNHTTTALLGAATIALAGCASQRVATPTVEPASDVEPTLAEQSELIRQDPIGYLRRVADNCAALDQYTLTFTRQERRGLAFFKRLHKPERIACRFRRQPFSIYMKWLDPDIKYGESTYVAGVEKNKVRFVPRHGLFGLPPTITRVDLQTPVIWGEAKYPLSEFGLKRMMERTLANIDRAGGDYEVIYKGVMRLTGSDRQVHALWFEFYSPEFKAPIREVFIDVESDLPACTRILHGSGALEAAYYWEDVDPNVAFTEDDFLLDAERDQTPSDASAASGATPHAR